MNNRKSLLIFMALVFGLVVAEGQPAERTVPRSREPTDESRSPKSPCHAFVDYGQFDPKRVDAFLGLYFQNTTGHWFSWFSPLDKRAQELDKRILSAALSPAEKIQVFKRLAPRAEDSRFRAQTDERKELRMERLLLSVEPKDLPLFKFALEHDGDYKDLEEYVFHDIDKKEYRDRIIGHFRKTAEQVGIIGIKVLSDVDDTMYANLVDTRYPKGTFYPGVLEFYDSLKHEPFELRAIPLTTLSARPNPIAGKLEEASLNRLVELTKGRLCPSALSGALVSSTAGTVETVLRSREELDLLSDEIPHDQEEKIGEVKFKNFSSFSELYPEYRYVFVGDSGQADALTAQRMLTKASKGTTRVVATFIHNLTKASPSFKKLPSDILVSKSSATGRGVIVFRNYIDAAIVAHMHSVTLENLVTARELARITRASLEQFKKINFRGNEASELRKQYRQDAEEAYRLLTKGPRKPSPLEEDLKKIRRMLDEGL